MKSKNILIAALIMAVITAALVKTYLQEIPTTEMLMFRYSLL